jgi:hypothetical protein
MLSRFISFTATISPFVMHRARWTCMRSGAGSLQLVAQNTGPCTRHPAELTVALTPRPQSSKISYDAAVMGQSLRGRAKRRSGSARCGGQRQAAAPPPQASLSGPAERLEVLGALLELAGQPGEGPLQRPHSGKGNWVRGRRAGHRPCDAVHTLVGCRWGRKLCAAKCRCPSKRRAPRVARAAARSS